MGDKLLIRAYNVGCGDCIYVRIPNGRDGFHILIDCGKKGGTELLEQAVTHLRENELPAGDEKGKKRLDLIVATHRHEDHIKGFNPEWFKNIQVKNIWLSAVMDPDHPQAGNVKKLHEFAGKAMNDITARGLALSPQVELLASLYGVSNDVADDLLMKDLPKANKIKPKFVHAGMTSKELGLKLDAATIRVLAPEENIDHFYLGKANDESLKGLQGIGGSFAAHSRAAADATPKNISAGDFRLLQSRLLSNGLAFAEKDSAIQNNMSVVLLIEWRKRRLLFVGDAEWDGEFKEGKQNGSWNVMWEKQHKLLNAPLDFLKVGHHGSINATPPPAGDTAKSGKKKPRSDGPPSVTQILDALLPVPKSGKTPTAQAIVSTEREFYAPIPECKLLVNLARRVRTRRSYGKSLEDKRINPKKLWATRKATENKFYETYEKDFLDDMQPLRTDLEKAVTGQDFIDVEIEPND